MDFLKGSIEVDSSNWSFEMYLSFWVKFSINEFVDTTLLLIALRPSIYVERLLSNLAVFFYTNSSEYL